VILLPGVRVTLPEQVSAAQTTIYGSVVATAGTLLGFSLAALAFLVALPHDAPLLERMRAQGTHEQLLCWFAAAVPYLGLLLLAGLLGLGLDRAPKSALTAHQLGTGAYWIWTLVAFGVPSVAGMSRATLALMDTLPVIVAAQHGRGERRPPTED
jgi:hypothetical protein